MFLIGLQDRSQVVSAHIKYHLIHHCIGGVHYTDCFYNINNNYVGQKLHKCKIFQTYLL